MTRRRSGSCSLHDFKTAHWNQEPASGRNANRRVRALPLSGSRGLSGPRSGGRLMEREQVLKSSRHYARRHAWHPPAQVSAGPAGDEFDFSHDPLPADLMPSPLIPLSSDGRRASPAPAGEGTYMATTGACVVFRSSRIPKMVDQGSASFAAAACNAWPHRCG